MSESNNTFKIGLCMAGAISAGAYTAGVIDYLMEALEEWQKRKDNNEPNTPSHNIQIPVIGGASAGGMTGIIAASALQDKIEPVSKLGSDLMAKQPNNKFYHSWVDLLSEDMLSILLKTDDITKEKGLQSFLNSDFIDKIAERALAVSENPAVSRKYIAENLKVFVTLSNLEGMDFTVTFRSNSPKFKDYIISSHNDYACFKLTNSEENYTDDGWIPLNFKSKLNTAIAKNAAMATGAFPVGLKARKVTRSSKYMNDLEWLFHITKEAKNPFKGDTYTTLNVDGGLIDNEPFDKIRDLLIKETNQKKSKEFQDYNTFKSTIVMIDPFPSEPGDFNKSTGLMNVIGNTLSAMIGQSRIKPSVLIDALDSHKAGQYLIAPVRFEKKGGKEESIEGKEAIACGSLDGFGGFLSKEFRVHDYFLGRANCEIFLRDHFTIPADTNNPIFINGYAGISDKSVFSSKSDQSLQIIPIFKERQPQAYMPTFSNGTQWPSVTLKQVNSYKKLVKARVEKVLFNVAEYTRVQKVLLWIGAKVVLNSKIADSVIQTVIKSLETHKLLKK